MKRNTTPWGKTPLILLLFLYLPSDMIVDIVGVIAMCMRSWTTCIYHNLLAAKRTCRSRM
jgi:hypothetical protein